MKDASDFEGNTLDMIDAIDFKMAKNCDLIEELENDNEELEKLKKRLKDELDELRFREEALQRRYENKEYEENKL